MLSLQQHQPQQRGEDSYLRHVLSVICSVRDRRITDLLTRSYGRWLNRTNSKTAQPR